MATSGLNWYPSLLGDFVQVGPPRPGEYLSNEYYDKHVREVVNYKSDTMQAQIVQDIVWSFVIVLIPWIFGDDESDADFRTKSARKVRMVFVSDTSNEAIITATAWVLDIDRNLSNLNFALNL